MAGVSSASLAARRKGRSSIGFERARPDDDPSIRRLLRQPLGGAIRLSLEREPDARLAAEIEGDRQHTIVTRDPASGHVVGLGSRSVRQVWINGEPARLGYLGQLRRDPALVGRVDVLASGFAELERTRLADELPFDLTSIVADNHRARRLLERGLNGLPRYRPVGELTTLILSARRTRRRASPRVQRASSALLPAIVDCLERQSRPFQFSPVWTEEDLDSEERTRGLAPEDFFVIAERGRVVACLALWNQRGFKQAVVRGYGPKLARWRPLLNVGLRAAGRPTLPRPGQELSLAYLSHVAVDPAREDQLVDLVRAALVAASRNGIDHLVVAFATGNALLPAMRRSFAGRAYGSVLYVVHRPEAEEAVRRLDGRIPHVEVATL